VKGTPGMDEPVAYAERRFGTTGPFLRRRKWNLDFYLGSFSDLAAGYRKMGYRRLYRLRAPYVSYGKQAWVLAPEPGLRPRLVYCGFYGQDLFLHARAQWAVLTELAKGEGPIVRTLTCPSCAWTQPGVEAMKRLLATVPFRADNAIVGYERLFDARWGERRMGVYENEYWSLAFYKTAPTVTVVVSARHTNFGEILAASLTPLVRRGARRVFYAGPAAQVDDGLDPSDLALPREFTLFTGKTIPFANALGKERGKGSSFAGLPSPLYATREWMRGAKRRGVAAFDGEMARVAEAAQDWKDAMPHPVECGIGAVLGSVTHMHPEEDRAVYTASTASQAGRESAKKEFVSRVEKILAADRRDEDDE
jgi:hypothetical protein